MEPPWNLLDTSEILFMEQNLQNISCSEIKKKTESPNDVGDKIIMLFTPNANSRKITLFHARSCNLVVIN